ncbi:hypothetical protein OIU78_010292 [Salix suchowensis]|nr:hypothetical protein OIU78_010292 [Salix suchowensis]
MGLSYILRSSPHQQTMIRNLVLQTQSSMFLGVRS